MRVLRLGSSGPAVELLQLALTRSGYRTDTDGSFGPVTKAALVRFQSERGLMPDGIAGNDTHRALLPYYTGYTIHTIRRGDTVWKLAAAYGTDEESILTANPGINVLNLKIGAQLIIPLPFPVVPTDISYCTALIGYAVRGLAARYPFISVTEAGQSVMRKPLWCLTIGGGENRVMYNASHHANEWITTPLLLKFIEELAAAYAGGGEIDGQSAAELLSYATLCIVPAVNPDGIDLVTGELSSGQFFERAVKISGDYPQFRFPQDWKANINGTDLNLQYPAGWEQARKNKEALGIVSPAPAEYVGPMPLSAAESRAMYDYTLLFEPSLVIACHTQGEVIYWKYNNHIPKGSEEIAGAFSELSGYAAENTPFASGFAGYKDWFIDSFDRPGFTIEAGKGKNPLPIGDFNSIYERVRGIFTLGMIVT